MAAAAATRQTAPASPLLRVEGLTLHYGAAQALFGVSLTVGRGETVSLVGANGAGKTSLLKAVVGLLRASGGSISFDGTEVTRSSVQRRVRAGIALCPEGRELFPGLKVRENLELGALAHGAPSGEVSRRLEEIYERFPRLKERHRQTAGTLSGGEQQMVAIGRALMAAPRLLLLDEPSLGLAPLVADEIFDSLHRLTRAGMTILLVEQNAARALCASARAYLMANGRVSGKGRSEALLVDPELRRTFLGAASENKPEASRLGVTGFTNVHLEPSARPKTFRPDVESEAALAAQQLAGLRWTLKHAYEGSAFYRERLDRAGVGPETVRTLEDLGRLPFTTADDLREGYPFPLRAVPFERIVRVHSSSGTTGKRKILAYSRKDVEDWTYFVARAYEMAGVTALDRVQIAVGYGLWAAGAGIQLGCERLGALAVPVGPGNLDLQCEFLVDLQSTVFCAPASMALLMAEEIHRRGLADTINVKKVIYGSERCSPSMRQRISDLFGGAELFDLPGLTELYGPGSGVECSQHDGIHYWADGYLLEILDAETLQPVPEGELGEMVVTTLRKEASPLIRYRTRDLARILPGRCACGSILPRHSRLAGRTDDMFKFRGVNIYPSTLEGILSQIPGLGSEYQAHLRRDASGRDLLRLVVERGRGVEPARAVELARELTYQIKTQLLVTVAADVIEYGSLPRSERTSERVFDKRIQDSVL
ncbi:MAG: ATP-binding cassette domain-containing protein [Deltaproteobacteria bacterium]|nr:ATP-binding cassette domain-containing protein [Deltaproteobacteria bacterium]